MREIRTSGSEGGGAGITGPSYPYRGETKSRLKPAPKSEPLLQEPGSPGFSVEA